MHKLTIIGLVLVALCGSAAAQVNVDTGNKVGQPGAAPKASPGGPSQLKGSPVRDEFDRVKSPSVVSPRDSQSGLPSGRR